MMVIPIIVIAIDTLNLNINNGLQNIDEIIDFTYLMAVENP